MYLKMAVSKLMSIVCVVMLIFTENVIPMENNDTGQSMRVTNEHLADVIRRQLMTNNYDYLPSDSDEPKNKDGSDTASAQSHSREKTKRKRSKMQLRTKQSSEETNQRSDTSHESNTLNSKPHYPKDENERPEETTVRHLAPDVKNIPDPEENEERLERRITSTSEEAERSIRSAREKEEKEKKKSRRSTNKKHKSNKSKKTTPEIDDDQFKNMLNTDNDKKPRNKRVEDTVKKYDLYNYVDDSRLAVVNNLMVDANDGDNGSKNQSFVASVGNETKHIKVLKLEDTRRSGRRKFFKEEGSGKVAIIKTDDKPFPEFRLGGDRRQYMLPRQITEDSSPSEHQSKENASSARE